MTQLSLVGLEGVEFKLLTNKFRAPGGEGYLFDTSHGRLGEEEVAAKLNITVDGLRSRLHRAEYDVTDNRVNKVRKPKTPVVVEAPSTPTLAEIDAAREILDEADNPTAEEIDRAVEEMESVIVDVDQFAIAAMNAIIMKQYGNLDPESFMDDNVDGIARMAYRMAEAMMDRRKIFWMEIKKWSIV